MSAAVCGKRLISSFEEELSSIPLAKKVRGDLNGLSRTPAGDLDTFFVLKQFFPRMDDQTIREALAYSGDNIEHAIQHLSSLRIHNNQQDSTQQNTTEGTSSSAVEPHESSRSIQGSDWVELAVRELSLSSSLEESKSRIARVFEAFEGAIKEGGSWQKEMESLREHAKRLGEENTVLKRAVAIQHSRQVEFEERGREVERLKATLVQYEAEMRSLQMTNYTLTVHLKAAQQPSEFPNRNNDIY